MASERKFIAENVKRLLVKEYVKSEIRRAGFGGLEIQRTPLGTRMTLITERPGIIIGKRGGMIKELTENLGKKFAIDNPQIDVQEVANANLNAHIMAQKLADALQRGWHFRRAGHSTVRRIMGAGAKGCQVTISGKLTGQRHRCAKFVQGHIKHCGEPSMQWVVEGQATALTKTGVLGVKVLIMDPNAKLPDEVELLPEKPPADTEKKTPKAKEAEVETKKPEVKAKPKPKRKKAERPKRPGPKGAPKKEHKDDKASPKAASKAEKSTKVETQPSAAQEQPPPMDKADVEGPRKEVDLKAPAPEEKEVEQKRAGTKSSKTRTKRAEPTTKDEDDGETK